MLSGKHENKAHHARCSVCDRQEETALCFWELHALEHLPKSAMCFSTAVTITSTASSRICAEGLVRIYCVSYKAAQSWQQSIVGESKTTCTHSRAQHIQLTPTSELCAPPRACQSYAAADTWRSYRKHPFAQPCYHLLMEQSLAPQPHSWLLTGW